MAFEQYPYGYNPYYPQRPEQRQQNGITWVQGENGAKAYMVAAGNTVLLMDSENETFYIKSTDASGMPMPLRAFDYKERKPQQAEPAQYVTRGEFDALLQRIDAMTKEATNESAL